MKTSNKLITIAVLLLVVSIIFYDYKLKAVYDSGVYKKPLIGFTTLNFKDFDTVDVISSTSVNVKFLQGPFKVFADSSALRYISLKKVGKRLEIAASYEDEYQYNPNPYLLIVTCPKLASVTTNAIYSAGGKRITDTVVRENWHMRRVLIEGFRQDSLSIKQNNGSTIVLSANDIKSVKVLSGQSNGSGSKLIVQKGNFFENADIDIRNKSSFFLNDANIKNLNYHLSDSAKMIVSGAAQNLLKVSSKPQIK